MSTKEEAIRDLVVANRILAHENVVDAYGHVSIRHPTNPERFLLSRSRSPELVEAGDIIEFALDGTPIGDTRPPYLERFIHGSIFAARPEVQAVVHAHAEDVLPFAITDVPLRPVFHAAADMGNDIPVWDIADKFGDDTDLLVRNVPQGQDLARCLGKNTTVLMRGHGFTAAADSLMAALRAAVFLPTNARILMAALRLGGKVKAMSPREVANRQKVAPNSPERQRAWEYWAKRAGCSHLLG